VVGRQERRAVNDANVIVSRQTEPAIGIPPMYAVAPVWYSPQTRQREALKRVATDIILLSVSSFFNSSGTGDNA